MNIPNEPQAPALDADSMYLLVTCTTGLVWMLTLVLTSLETGGVWITAAAYISGLYLSALALLGAITLVLLVRDELRGGRHL